MENKTVWKVCFFFVCFFSSLLSHFMNSALGPTHSLWQRVCVSHWFPLLTCVCVCVCLLHQWGKVRQAASATAGANMSVWILDTHTRKRMHARHCPCSQEIYLHLQTRCWKSLNLYFSAQISFVQKLMNKWESKWINSALWNWKRRRVNMFSDRRMIFKLHQ